MAGPNSRNGPGPFILESFRVRNFRCIQDATLDVEPDITVLVGRNDTGKTALLEALNVYGRLNEAGHRELRTLWDSDDVPEGVSFVARWASTSEGVTCEHVMPGTVGEPEVITRGDRRYVWHPRERRLEADGTVHNCRTVSVRPVCLGMVNPDAWRTETDLPEPICADLAIVARLPRGTPPYLFHPQALATGVPMEVDAVGGAGFGWAMWLQRLVGRRDGTLEKLESCLRGLFPFFRRIRGVEDRVEVKRTVLSADGTPIEKAGTRGFRDERYLDRVARSESERRVEYSIPAQREGALFEDEDWVPAHAESAGVLIASAYLTLAWTCDPESMVSVEEPENGLNADIATRMMEVFLEVVRERRLQLIMTTHDAMWLDYVEPRSVRVVTRDTDGTSVHAGVESMEAIKDSGYHLSESMLLDGPEALLRGRREDR